MNRIEELLIAEATIVDFKEKLETAKPKSWLKSVSAFANSIGGSLLYGIKDETKELLGLDNPQAVIENVSKLIEKNISPLPLFEVIPIIYKDKSFVEVKVSSGTSTPYYIKVSGSKEAYIRSGSNSIPAPDHILRELVLKGSKQTYDSIVSGERKNDYSFTLFEATYLQKTGMHIEPSDYISFGLATEDGYLTNAGMLLADQYIVYNSRIFCTRWNGLDKGSVWEDTLDDKEFEGNLLYLKKSAEDFVKTNTKRRFRKRETDRLDKPDYAPRAIEEAIVNALIHRSYQLPGSEIHIDIYDDRLEIVSPGGMINGGNIQDMDIYNLSSLRRHPVLADLFHRMHFMERRGSGLKDIVKETANLPGYTEDLKPEFKSTHSNFWVIFKNANYTPQDTAPINEPINEPISELSSPINPKLNAGSKESIILEIIKTNPIITRQFISEISGIPEPTVRRIISNLTKQNIIKRSGSNKSGGWIIL